MTLHTSLSTLTGKKYPKEPLAIELEVEFTEPPKDLDVFLATNKMWVTHEDNSLRHTGVEFVSNGPSSLSALTKQLTALLNYVKSNDYIKNSPRTSMHVHYNVSSMTPLQIWTAVVAYWLVEDLLFSICGDHREGNLFCRRLKDSAHILKLCTQDVKNQENFSSLYVDNVKYGGINLSAVSAYGSLEFRGMSGDICEDNYTKWMTTLHDLVYRSKVFKTPADLLDRYYNSDRGMFLQNLVGPLLPVSVVTAPAAVEENLMLLLDFVYSTNWDTVRVVPVKTLPKKSNRPVRLDFDDVRPAINQGD